jgi:hypothetical protein
MHLDAQESIPPPLLFPRLLQSFEMSFAGEVMAMVECY